MHEALWSALKAEETWRGEFENRCKDGASYWVLATITPVRDELGMVTRYVAIEEDISKQRKMIEISLRNSNRLVMLVDNLLDASAIRSGLIQLRRNRRDLVEILRSAVESLEPIARKLGVDVKLELPADLAGVVDGEENPS